MSAADPSEIHAMAPKFFCAIASAVFGVVALVHFARAVLDVTITVDGAVLPGR